LETTQILDYFDKKQLIGFAKALDIPTKKKNMYQLTEIIQEKIGRIISFKRFQEIIYKFSNFYLKLLLKIPYSTRRKDELFQLLSKKIAIYLRKQKAKDDETLLLQES